MLPLQLRLCSNLGIPMSAIQSFMNDVASDKQAILGFDINAARMEFEAAGIITECVAA
jgi:hypothetical protein